MSRYGESCDYSKLSPAEAKEVAVAEHQRNFSNCKYGVASCNHSKLTTLEGKEVTVAEHQRNYTACAEGYQDCDKCASQGYLGHQTSRRPVPVSRRHPL
jgi:hypothetical protein